eukprot:TRINITY_DN4277_c0_g1_i6.p1 TRINITY_DN4277_c0_g1~~TRINITY_DN4277_c0_g1_i6.p1  ORF type:complete len:808 (+),score=168.22 TRINITY_DN4277_c0_g1_i6:96-2519(+)
MDPNKLNFLRYRQRAGLPNHIQIYPTSDKIHLFFLGSQASQNQDLYHASVDISSAAPDTVLGWQNLVALQDTIDPSAMSLEEQLLRERQRTSALGLTSYQFSATNGKLLVPAGGKQYITDIPKGEWKEEGPLLLGEVAAGGAEGAKMDSKLSPDASLLSYVSQQDIWLTELSTNTHRRITFSPAHHSCGVAEFVMQEEFDRYTGYWWAPTTTQTQTHRVYRLLFVEVDESQVPLLHFTNPLTASLDSYRYPRAGETNAVSRLKVAQISIPHNGGLSAAVVEVYDLSYDMKEWVGDWEYLVRADWTNIEASPNSLWVQVLDRQQQHLSMLLLDFDKHFSLARRYTPDGAEEKFPISQPQPCDSPVIWRQDTDVWINVTDICHFMSDGSGVLVASEQSGFRHLHWIDLRLPFGSENREVALCEGPWVMEGGEVWIDEARCLAFFTGFADTPLQRHLYVISFQHAHQQQPQSQPLTPPLRLTEAGLSHEVSVYVCGAASPVAAYFVSTASNSRSPPRTTLFSFTPTPNSTPTSTPPQVLPLAQLAHATHIQPEVELVRPEIFSFKDNDLYGAVFLPPNYQPDQRYPTVIYVYGGPHVQLVRDEWYLTETSRLQLLASLGFVVALADGSGSWNRGLAFEGRLRLHMGQVEVADQVSLVSELVARGYTDPARVAITGWSYGGYLTLMALALAPHVFKIGVSGAPVTYWEAYDTGYTERYMDTPQRNEAGYQQGSVLRAAPLFPQQEDRLMIVHGLLDENVHFTHTASFIQALVSHSKPYHLKVFPNERHGLRSWANSTYFYSTMASFLSKNL